MLFLFIYSPMFNIGLVHLLNRHACRKYSNYLEFQWFFAIYPNLQIDFGFVMYFNEMTARQLLCLWYDWFWVCHFLLWRVWFFVFLILIVLNCLILIAFSFDLYHFWRYRLIKFHLILYLDGSLEGITLYHINQPLSQWFQK